MAKKRKRIDYDSPLMNIYSPEYQYLMKQNAPENANVAGLGDWFSNLFRRNKQQPDYHRDTVSMGLGTENSLQGISNGGTDWNNQDFSLTGQLNQQQFNYNPNQELTTSQQYQNTLKDPENLAPKQTGEQSTQPSTGSNVNWGGIIGTAATATANAIRNGGSAADIVANAMGIPVLAKMWKANTEKGDANIKSAQEAIASVQDNKYIQDANSLQGVGNALKLNMSNKPKMIDTSGFQRMTNWKDFSSGRGSGTWWKNMATAQFQGAASGSVGGPWGALGGATAGLLGSIGGLFGGKKRAKRAMNEYNQRMDSLRAYATAENLRRKADYELSNQNAIHNGLGQQSIKEMSNFRAMGGNLYTDLSPNMMNLWNDKQNIDKQKIMNQQINLGLGNSFNTKLNTFDYGGSMNGMNLPTDMQYYENGGSHEENPNGGIQVGQDQQGNPNLVEEGEFRYGDYIFSDRIPVDYSILSDFNVEKGKINRNTKNNPTYAELAKKTADKYKDLNDKISKDSLNKQLDRLQQSQEAQKFKEQQDQQYAYYTNALKSPTQGNPMYGNMKYNGMGNANQGINTGVDEGMSNAMDNSDLSNVNRSGNPMMAAYGGNIYKDGDEMSFIIPKSLLGSVRTPSLSYSTPTLNNFSSFVDVNSDKNINNNQSYEYLNNYFTSNQVADLRESYGLSRAGGIDTPFVKNVQKMIGVRRNGNFDDKSQLALNKFANYPTEDVVNPNNSQYGTTQGNSFGTSTSTKVAAKTQTQATLKDENTSDENIKTINGNESAVNNTMAVSGKGPQEPVEVDYNLGRPAAGISDYTDPTVPMYNDNGYWANLAKGIMPNLMNWSGQANWNYNPDWRPSNSLEALGHSSYASRTSDHLGDYIAPNLMDIERLNNQAMAQTAAQQRGIQNISGGNRGFVGAQGATTDYNGQMGIGNNYVTAEQYNAEQQQKAAEFNRDTNKFNAQANNDMYRDNLNAWMQGRQMDIQAMEAANRERQLERQYKDRVDRDAALNRSSDLGAMADNMINTVVDNALYNRGLNNINTKLNNRYYFDKDKGWTYKGDTGIGRQINEYAKGVRLTSDDYTQINNILKEDPHNIAGIEGIIDARRAEQDKQDIKDFNDKHNSIIADFDNYSSLMDDALFSDIYKNEDRLAFNKARDKYEEVINDKKSTSSQKERAYNDFRNKVNQMKNKYALYKGMVYSQRNKPFDLTPEEYATLYEKRQKDNKSAYGGKINTRKHREYSYTDI